MQSGVVMQQDYFTHEKIFCLITFWILIIVLPYALSAYILNE